MRGAAKTADAAPAAVPSKRDRRMPRHTDHPQGLALTSPN
jgi:hypothetical protein